MTNPRHNHYSFEWAADHATHPMARSALLLEAARVHRRNAQSRIALAKSHGWPKACSDYQQAYAALYWAVIAVSRAKYYRQQSA